MNFNHQHIRLKEIRKSLGFNQQEFSELLGIDQAHLSQLEHGKIGIGNRIMVTLIEKFNISSDWIYTGKGSMFKHNDTEIIAEAIIDIEKIISNLKIKGIKINIS